MIKNNCKEHARARSYFYLIFKQFVPPYATELQETAKWNLFSNELSLFPCFLDSLCVVLPEFRLKMASNVKNRI